MYAYNPRKKTAEQLGKMLVGEDRWDTLRDILKEMDLKYDEVPKQHWMIIGPRGIGKSHLMTLLYHKIKKDKDLNSCWIPLLFPEELRIANNLQRFLERISREILLELKDNPICDELKLKIDRVNAIKISKRTDSLFDLITWVYKISGKHIVVIAENFQQLLGKKLQRIEQKKLRAFLQTNDAILMISSATTIFDALHDHSHPFYNFFHIKKLIELDFDEMKILIAKLLSESGRDDLAKKLENNDARLKALYSFTGGNPRMAVFMSDFLRAEIPSEMLELMDNILDQLTPYFENIFSDIPDHLEDVINALAELDPAQSPKEIAEYLEVPQATMRNYLKKLKETGYVRIAFSKGKSNYYCLNEYLYRIWYQMRDSSHREETRWIMELLLILYSPTTIIQEKNKIGMCNDEVLEKYSYDQLIYKTAEFMEKNPEYCTKIEFCINANTLIHNDLTIPELEEIFHKDVTKFIEDKNYEKVEKLFTNFIKENSESSFGYTFWGSYLFGTDKYEEAIDKFEKALEIDPSDEDSYFNWGYCLYELERFEEALEKFEKAFQINPDPKGDCWPWGDCLRELNRFDEAIIKFDEIIKKEPESPYAHGAKGDCLIKLGRIDEAINTYQKAIEVDPTYEDAYRAWSYNLMELEQFKEAMLPFKMWVKQFPNSDSAYLRYGDCLSHLNKKEKAISMFKKAIRLNPKSEDNYGWLGVALHRLGEYKEAIANFDKAIELNPEAIQAYSFKAECLLKLNKHNKAKKILEGQLENSDDCRLIHAYGNCLLQGDSLDEALQQFENLIGRDEVCYKAYQPQGEILEKMGNKDFALFSYINYIRGAFEIPVSNFDFIKVYQDQIHPILKSLEPSNYIKRFYEVDMECNLSKVQLSTLLLLLKKYDTIEEELPNIIGRNEFEKHNEIQELNLFLFTIKFCAYLSLCSNKFQDALRIVGLLLSYIKMISIEEDQQVEVSNFLLTIFNIQIQSNIDSESTLKILKLFKDEEDVPFNEVLLKIWKCISEPNSIEAKKYLNDKGIAEIVRELNKKGKIFTCDI